MRVSLATGRPGPAPSELQGRLQRMRESRRSLSGGDRFVPSLPELSDEQLFQSRPPGASSFRSLLLAGNPVDLDPEEIDFAALRADREQAGKVLRGLRRKVRELEFEARLKDHPDLTREEFRGWLESPRGLYARRRIRDRVRHLTLARYLQAHGVVVSAEQSVESLAELRKYIQREDNSYNLVDAIRAINRTSEQGQFMGQALVLAAERELYGLRGVPPQEFDASGRDGFWLSRLRDFTDAWTPSRSGKHLRAVLGQLNPESSLDQAYGAAVDAMLDEAGFGEDLKDLELGTRLSLLRDLDPEGPRTQRLIVDAVKRAVREGERDYAALSAIGNQSILEELGLGSEQLSRMDLPVQPEIRAERLRVLRDYLYVLPGAERVEALHVLEGTNLETFQAALHRHLYERAVEHLGRGLADHLVEPMGTQQRANFVSGLAGLPEDLRLTLVDGLSGSGAEQDARIKDRLASRIESAFQVSLHRRAGTSPAEGWEAYAPFISDWSLQGLVDLYSALDAVATGGRLPEGLRGTTTYLHMTGSAPATPLVAHGWRHDEVPRPLPRPGATSHATGVSGYLGEADADSQGHDFVVMYDDALYGPNSDGTPGFSTGQGTLIHETAHAIQLGGTPGGSPEARLAEQKLKVAEWSSLSGWIEPDGALADGYLGEEGYYYDPSVRVAERNEVATSYGASDPVEDWAEYSCFFYRDPEVALRLAPEKFLYFNREVANHYSDSEIAALGLRPSELAEAREEMDYLVAGAAEWARPRPGQLAPAV